MPTCPCCSDTDYDECCGPYLNGSRKAPTAEALMRARYTAFTRADIDYIRRTRHERSRDDFDEAAILKWARDSEWLALEILKITNGAQDDETGEVEFSARYIQDGEEQDHRERAIFQKEEDEWFFLDGDALTPETYVREQPKVGRNEPCPCGSGKKYKKCCSK